MSLQSLHATSIDAEEAEHITETVGWLDPRYVPTERSGASCAVDEVDLGALTVTCEAWDRPVHICTATPERSVGVSVRMGDRGECTGWGRAWERDAAGVVTREVDVLIGADAAFCATVVPRELLDRVAVDLGLNLQPTLARSSGLVDSQDGAVQALRRAFHNAITVAPFDLARREAESGLLVATCELMAEPQVRTEVRLAPPERLRIARAARDYIDQHLVQSLCLADVTRAVGVNVRRLQRAFRSSFGMAPVRYLHASRLRLARARLVAAEPGSTTVTSVARACGFGHMGRFSIDYREAFCESPSTTLRRPACRRDAAALS